MKKLMTAFAVCLVAGLVSAQIFSQNVVGYVTRNLDNESGVFSLGVPMINLGTVDGSTVVTNAEFFGTTLQNLDIVMVLNTDYLALDTYQYSNGGWYLTPGEGEVGDIPVEGITLPVGAAVYCITAAGSVVMAGEVAASGVQQVVYDTTVEPSGIFDFANPFPVATKLQDIGGIQNLDIVLVLNYDYLALDTYQYSNGGWYLTPGEGEVGDIPVASTTEVLPVAGSGYFMPSSSPRTLSFTLNY